MSTLCSFLLATNEVLAETESDSDASSPKSLSPLLRFVTPSASAPAERSLYRVTSTSYQVSPMAFQEKEWGVPNQENLAIAFATMRREKGPEAFDDGAQKVLEEKILALSHHALGKIRDSALGLNKAFLPEVSSPLKLLRVGISPPLAKFAKTTEAWTRPILKVTFRLYPGFEPSGTHLFETYFLHLYGNECSQDLVALFNMTSRR